jgi:hypothetical protein
MNKEILAGGLGILGFIFYFYPSFNMLGGDIPLSEIRVMGAVFMTGAIILWYLPKKV